MRLSKNKLLGAEPTCWSLGGSESGPLLEHEAVWQSSLLLDCGAPAGRACQGLSPSRGLHRVNAPHGKEGGQRPELE